MKITGIIFIILIRCHLLLASDFSFEPWEEEIETEEVAFKEKKVQSNFIHKLLIKSIRYYQSDISVQTISRCPFYTSCSNYAFQAIEKKGIVIGLAMFIDRNIYRENTGAYFYYPKKINKNGVLKLDDDFYLEN